MNAEQPVKYRSTRDLPSLSAFINEQLGTTTVKEAETEEGGEEQDVPSPLKGLIELNDKNFGDLTSKGNWFIKFFAPWSVPLSILCPGIVIKRRLSKIWIFRKTKMNEKH